MSMDGFRFLDSATREVMRAWFDREPGPDAMPWTPLRSSLAESRVALISSAGISLLDDAPFDQDGERLDPWWGDPTYRVLPRETTTGQVRVSHLHMDPRPAAEDLDCLLPLRRLDELVEAGAVGSSAPNHYSIMGYILKPRQLVEETAPALAGALVGDEVDLALLVPV